MCGGESVLPVLLLCHLGSSPATGLLDPGIEPGSLTLQADSLLSEPRGKLDWKLKANRETKNQ